LAVFRTRLGLSFADAIGTVDDSLVRRITVDLIDHATATRDGYVARDVLAHNGCRELLTDSQARELSDLVEACALGRGTLPVTLLANLTTALACAEEVMARSVKTMSGNVNAPANP
jgi:hypothetical protein